MLATNRAKQELTGVFSIQAKFEDFRQRVELLNRKLSELDVKHAGLASQNKVLEEQVATIRAKREEVSPTDV